MADTSTPWQRAFFDVLDRTCGGPRRRSVLLEATLASAGMVSLPTNPMGLLAFSGTHLVGALDRVVGPNAGKQFLEDLAHALARVQ